MLCDSRDLLKGACVLAAVDDVAADAESLKAAWKRAWFLAPSMTVR